MKKLMILSLICSLMLAGLFFSCSKEDSADTRSILETVPSDVSALTVFNVKALLKKAGCDVDGTSITPGKEITSAIAVSTNPRCKRAANIFFSGDSGIDPTVAALFIEGYNTYLTGFVADPDKFKAAVEKEFIEKFSKHDEVEKCGNIALQGNRFWMCVSSVNTINAQDVRHFTSLSENQSFVSLKAAETILPLDHDVMIWGDIKGVLNASGADFNSKAMAGVAMEALFADASQMLGNADFHKGKMQLSLGVINSKGETAKFLYPTAKIDPQGLRQIGGKADMLVAAAISPKIVDKLKKDTSSKGISMIGIYANLLSCVDGTCGVAIGNDGIMSGLFTTKGQGTSDLSDMLSQFGMKVEKKDNLLLFSNGTPAGRASVADLADMTKGAMIAVSLTPDPNKSTGDGELNLSKVKDIALLVVPQSNGIRIDIKAESNDPKANFILSLF